MKIMNNVERFQIDESIYENTGGYLVTLIGDIKTSRFNNGDNIIIKRNNLFYCFIGIYWIEGEDGPLFLCRDIKELTNDEELLKEMI